MSYINIRVTKQLSNLVTTIMCHKMVGCSQEEAKSFYLCQKDVRDVFFLPKRFIICFPITAGSKNVVPKC